jgi:hypothetical protein
MKNINIFIKESIEENTYCIKYAYSSDDRFSYSYATSLKRAQSTVKKLNGMKVMYVYIVPSNNVEQFKKLVKKNNDEKIKELYTERYVRSPFKDKDEINSFLDKK